MSRRVVALFVVAVVAALLPVAGAAGGQGSGGGGGFFALTGAEAASYRVPGDMELEKRFHLAAHGVTYERYQQVFGDHRAQVLGGQVTLYRDAGGTVETVIGAHYPDISPVNTVSISRSEAASRADRDVGPALERRVELLIDPASNRYLYRVESIQVDHRWFHLIDAGSGARVERFDALAHQCELETDAPCGLGVAARHGDTTDVKDLSGLTTKSGSAYLLDSGRQKTHDQGSTRRPFLGPIASDDNDVWIEPGRISPGQAALIDAQYYANVTDDYLLAAHGYDWVAEGDADPDHNISAMVTHAHYSADYVNAFWNGSYVAIGDGDGLDYRELTPLDVVAHEFTHGVTDFTSNLIYQDESGALNESFSDILAAAAEKWAEIQGLEPGTTLEPDWTVGEDLHLTGNGFRNMGDPEEDGDPDHYTERYTGTGDNGGVHINSAIPNHAFYLLVVGGENASCRDVTFEHDDLHCADDGLTSVSSIGLSAAEDIFFLAFTALTENATMCDARSATVGVAGTNSTEVGNAWTAVGVTSTLCGGGGGETNTAPSASIINPANGATVSSTVTVQIDASDSEDAAGTLTVEFNIDGGNWQAAAYNSTSGYYEASWNTAGVSDGSHTVNARATDIGGLTGTDSHTVTVSNPTSGGGTMHVGDLHGASAVGPGPNWDATVTITVHDSGEGAVEGATVNGAWSDGTTASCTTDGSGTCVVTGRFNSRHTLTERFTVGSVTHTTLSYDATANHDPDIEDTGGGDWVEVSAP